MLDEFIKKIDPKTDEEKKELKDLKQERLEQFEHKVRCLSFLPETGLFSSYVFHHFHPIAFVQQMNRMEEFPNDGTTIDFHIYSENDTIKRYTPTGYNNDENNPNILKYRYLYHIGGRTYHITTLNGIIADEYAKGTSKYNESYHEVNTNSDFGPRYYNKLDNKIVLVKLPEASIDVTVGIKRIQFTEYSSRNYISPEATASFFGVLAKCSFSDFVINFNGCTCELGIGYPSVSHVGGYNLDFRYIRKDRTVDGRFVISGPDDDDLDLETQNKFIDALNLYGWSDMLGHNPTDDTKFKVNHCSGHKDHLHCQGYDKNKIIK